MLSIKKMPGLGLSREPGIFCGTGPTSTIVLAYNDPIEFECPKPLPTTTDK